MYTIEKDKLGQMDLYRLTLGGFMNPEEVANWVADSTREFDASGAPFSVALDMRSLMPLSEDARHTLKEGQKQFMAHGMVRTAVLVHNVFNRLHFEIEAEEKGDLQCVKYFAATEPEWEQAMNDWMEKGKYTPSQAPPPIFSNLESN